MYLSLLVINIQRINYNTVSLKTTRPTGFSFVPGHSCLLHLPGTEQHTARAFTFISTNQDPHLEFLIKKSADPKSITHLFMTAKPNDVLTLTGLFGTHRSTGPGTFIAAGIGIAPFLAIARSHPDLAKESTVVWSLKQATDIIYELELRQRFKDVIITLTQETHPTYQHGRITKELLTAVPLHTIQTCGSYEFNKEMNLLIAKLNQKLQ
ncbi:hypothetical protein EXS73_02915 [Candidatus Pacearchaeota archaeon]|nr:hypothetical protein [Candidatus Pacearchaeota archaeon]